MEIEQNKSQTEVSEEEYLFKESTDSVVDKYTEDSRKEAVPMSTSSDEAVEQVKQKKTDKEEDDDKVKKSEEESNDKVKQKEEKKQQKKRQMKQRLREYRRATREHRKAIKELQTVVQILQTEVEKLKGERILPLKKQSIGSYGSLRGTEGKKEDDKPKSSIDSPSKTPPSNKEEKKLSSSEPILKKDRSDSVPNDSTKDRDLSPKKSRKKSPKEQTDGTRKSKDQK